MIFLLTGVRERQTPVFLILLTEMKLNVWEGKVIVMDERRKNKRMGIDSKIMLKRLDGGGTEKEVGIAVSDISKTGVGFTCAEPLTIGAVYETYLTIWTKEVLHAFIEIVRIEKFGDQFGYGAIFIGMPESDLARISVYQTVQEHNQ